MVFGRCPLNSRAVFLALLLAAAAEPSVAATDAELRAELSRCAGLKGSVQRLDCYDALAEKVGRPAAPKTFSPATLEPTGTPPRSGAAVHVRCQATTKKGAQCKRNASAGSSYCWQHP